MLWSILICGIPERYHLVQPLLHSLLEKQSVARMPDVELLFLMDNKRRPVGAKRNDMLAMAVGEYVSFIDDDDLVSDDYVQKIYRQIVEARKFADVEDDGKNPCSKCESRHHTNGGCLDRFIDVICFPQRATLQPANVIHECTYSLAYWKDREPDKRRALAPIPGDDGKPRQDALAWTGPPAHTMVWRRAILEGVRFPEKNFQEDVDFVDQACELAKNEIVMNGEPLYFYRFNEATTATR